MAGLPHQRCQQPRCRHPDENPSASSTPTPAPSTPPRSRPAPLRHRADRPAPERTPPPATARPSPPTRPTTTPSSPTPPSTPPPSANSAKPAANPSTTSAPPRKPPQPRASRPPAPSTPTLSAPERSSRHARTAPPAPPTPGAPPTPTGRAESPAEQRPRYEFSNHVSRQARDPPVADDCCTRRVSHHMTMIDDQVSDVSPLTVHELVSRGPDADFLRSRWRGHRHPRGTASTGYLRSSGEDTLWPASPAAGHTSGTEHPRGRGADLFSPTPPRGVCRNP
ncbi:hypothetical protein SDIAM103S_05761 [Streptomyces diastaticus subsp. diastaticus]